MEKIGTTGCLDFLKLSTREPVDIEFEDVTFEVKQVKSRRKKKVLHGLSGKFLSGELTAIMGPSGAGKSSLLNILSGFRNTGVRGTVVCGKALRRQISDINKTLCNQSRYIMQDDDLWVMFTVSEVMHTAANFKLGYSKTPKCRQALIEAILKGIGLENVTDTKSGRLSGGQKKRLSIAQELLDDPQVLFLDEPTTGLDSSSTLQVISVLKTLARGGRNIVCTIHQPCSKVLSMFDHVYVVSEGRCIYQGSSDNIVPFLSSVGLICPQYHSPIDFMLEVASEESGDLIESLTEAAKETTWRQPYIRESRSIVNFETAQPNSLEESPIGKKTILTWLKRRSEIAKYPIFLNRCLLQIHRDWTLVYLKCCLHLLVGVVFGFFFANVGEEGSRAFSNVLYLLSSMLYLTFTTAMPSALHFPLEIAKLKKERFNNWYYLRSYYITLMITWTPIQVVMCLLHISPSYVLTSQPLEWWRFVMSLLVYVIVTLLSESLGLLLGSLFSPVNGVFVGSVFLCFCVLFAGCLVLFSHMKLVFYYISFISFFRYGAIAVLVAMFGHGRKPLRCGEDYCHLKNPRLLLQMYGVEEDEYWFNVAMLVVYLFVLRIATYFALRYRMKSR